MRNRRARKRTLERLSRPIKPGRLSGGGAGPPAAPQSLTGLFVDFTSGNDTTGNGSEALPWKTIKKAYDNWTTGTIYVWGTATPLVGEHLTGKSGTALDPILITNYPERRAILDGINFNDIGDGYPTSTLARGAAINVWRADHVHIVGTMVLDGTYKMGIRITQFPVYGINIQLGATLGAKNAGNWVKFCEIDTGGYGTATEGKGIGAYGYGEGIELDDNDIHSNADTASDNADAIQAIIHGVALTGNTIRRNRCYWNSDDGIDLFNTSASTTCASILVEGNWVFENGYLADGVTPSIGDGNGLKLGGGGATAISGAHIVRNNICWDNRVDNIEENGARSTLDVYNNTAFRAGSKNYDFPGDNIAANLRNNVSYLGTVPDILGTGTFGLTATYNSWDLGIVPTSSDFVSVDDSVAKGPRNSDGSLPSTTFLTLASGSLLIDEGVDVGLAYTGNGPDLGWKESAFTAPADITYVRTGMKRASQQSGVRSSALTTYWTTVAAAKLADSTDYLIVSSLALSNSVATVDTQSRLWDGTTQQSFASIEAKDTTPAEKSPLGLACRYTTGATNPLIQLQFKPEAGSTAGAENGSLLAIPWGADDKSAVDTGTQGSLGTTITTILTMTETFVAGTYMMVTHCEGSSTVGGFQTLIQAFEGATVLAEGGIPWSDINHRPSMCYVSFVTLGAGDHTFDMKATHDHATNLATVGKRGMYFVKVADSFANVTSPTDGSSNTTAVYADSVSTSPTLLDKWYAIFFNSNLKHASTTISAMERFMIDGVAIEEHVREPHSTASTANSFRVAFADMSAGAHTLKIQAANESGSGAALAAKAMIDGFPIEA